MAKKVTENHNISSDELENDMEFEDMVEGLNPDEAPAAEAESSDADETPTADNKDATSAKKKSSGKSGNVIVLKKAATYSGCGLKFKKNEPTPVEDETIYKKLLSTGLFDKA